MIRAYLNDPYEYMSQEPCDYCPYQNTDKCDEDNCNCMSYGIQEGELKLKNEDRPQSDLISRSALKKKIEEVQYTQEFCIEHQIDYSVSMQMLGMVIDNAPTVCNDNYAMGYQDGVRKVLSERPQGKWIDTGNMEEYWAEEYQCSICGAKDHWHHYCPTCGAYMGESEDEDYEQ